MHACKGCAWWWRLGCASWARRGWYRWRCSCNGVGVGDAAGIYTPGLLTEQGKTSDGAAPFTRQEQRQGSTLHRTGAATGQRPSRDRNSDKAAALHDSSNGHRTQGGGAPSNNTTARGQRPQHSKAQGASCPLHNGTTGGLVPLQSRTGKGQRPAVPPSQHGGRGVASLQLWLNR